MPIKPEARAGRVRAVIYTAIMNIAESYERDGLAIEAKVARENAKQYEKDVSELEAALLCLMKRHGRIKTKLAMPVAAFKAEQLGIN